MSKLEVISGLHTGESYKLADRETLVGRHPECQIVLRDSTVSRRHARITRDREGYYVDDVGSQHGTRVNGELIRLPYRLQDRDEILLSQTKLVFLASIDGESSVNEPERSSTIITSLDVLRGSEVKEENAPKWRALLDITRALGVSLDLTEILPNVLENIFQILPWASRGHIMLTDGPLGQLKPYAVKDTATTGDPGPPAISRTITETVMSKGKAVLSADAGEDERFQASESVFELKMHSVLCAPLVGSANEPIGMIHLDAQDPTQPFTSDDLDVLVNIANLVGQAVDHAHLHEIQLEFARRERDLETARQVQLHFLPQERPSVSGYSLFDYYNPADAVGGDYFGYTWLPDGQLAIAVGDVAGHGTPAALLMARLCTEARYSLVTNIIPSEAVQWLNRDLCKSNFTFFITFALCVLDPIHHELTVVNAGHMPPLLRRNRTGEVEPLGVDIVSPPLGIDERLVFDQATTELEPGDVVVLYTDGVSEALHKDGSMYGNDRVVRVAHQAVHAQQIVNALMQDVISFNEGRSQEDDICVVAFSREK